MVVAIKITAVCSNCCFACPPLRPSFSIAVLHLVSHTLHCAPLGRIHDLRARRRAQSFRCGTRVFSVMTLREWQEGLCCRTNECSQKDTRGLSFANRFFTTFTTIHNKMFYYFSSLSLLKAAVDSTRYTIYGSSDCHFLLQLNAEVKVAILVILRSIWGSPVVHSGYNRVAIAQEMCS